MVKIRTKFRLGVRLKFREIEMIAFQVCLNKDNGAGEGLVRINLDVSIKLGVSVSVSIRVRVVLQLVTFGYNAVFQLWLGLG